MLKLKSKPGIGMTIITRDLLFKADYPIIWLGKEHLKTKKRG